MERVSFPLMSAQDIYSHLRYSLDLQVPSEADLLNPKPDNIKELYSTLIEVCLRRQRLDFMKPSAEQQQLLKYPEQHERATELMSLFSHTRKLLDKIGCRGEFKINDFFKPEFKRHRRFLSAIINFIKFSTEETAMLFSEDNLKSSTDRSKADLQRVKAEIDRVQGEVLQLRRRKLEMLPVISEKQQQIEQLVKSVAENHAKDTMLEGEVRTLQESIVTHCRNIDEAKARNQEVTSRLAAVREQVVNSPDKVVEQLETLRRQLDAEKQDLVVEKNTNFELASQRELVEEVKLKLYRSKLALDSYSESMKRLDNLKHELRVLKTKVAEAENEHNKKQYTLKYLESQSIIKQEAVMREAKASEHRLYSLEQQLQDKQAELRRSVELSEELKGSLRAAHDDLGVYAAEKRELLDVNSIRERKDLEFMQLYMQEVQNLARQLRPFFESQGIIP
jgi:chromosome segregation ATPase